MSIVQVFYISRCDHSVTPTDVHRIVGSSQVRNRRRQVTGLLAYSGQHFAQVVEGSAAEVDGLLDSISGDPRHQQMKVLQRLEGVPRRFGNWSMHLVDSVARSDEIEKLFNTPDDSVPAATAAQLLDAIAADVHWHHADDLAPEERSRS
ncbi:BLUF domain-containing protein [Piscinibacter sp. HJYY11]|uniref:BLUF domain-containing protein n=1 Tax=Piscinibacter sp. HJYY11 TaxID=2801333 RepID=UPI00191D2DE9|nr:BLUF domain-containing protein [Piscinibacter sp. HJYY11]MBL0730021.1 BLUF domain-containing protein [Piscinibacter sp. HJYY11]